MPANWVLLGGIAFLGAIGGLLFTRTSKAAESPAHPKASGPMHYIQKGSHGPDVAVWRQVVGLPAGDTFDDETEARTKTWQASNGLVGDGKVGHDSWTKAGYEYQAAATGANGGNAPVQPSAQNPSTPAPLPDASHVDSGDSGRTWAHSIPRHATAEREAAVVAAIKAGFYIKQKPVAVSYDKAGRKVRIFAYPDAFMIGHVDPVRVNVWHRTAQQIADMLGLMLPTSRMSDAAWLSASKLHPQVGAADSLMADTWREDAYQMKKDANGKNIGIALGMLEHSDQVEKRKLAAGAPSGTLVRCVGKDWVNTERLIGTPPASQHSSIGGSGDTHTPAGANYGWQDEAAGLWNPPKTIHVYQSIGLAHPYDYTDYSETFTLYGLDCEIDGASRSVEEVMKDPATAFLLSDEVQEGKAAQIWRHPGVPFEG